jgi:hypothetical protein
VTQQPATPAFIPPKDVGKEILYKELSTIIPDPEHVPVDEDTRRNSRPDRVSGTLGVGEEETRPTGDYSAYENRDTR